MIEIRSYQVLSLTAGPALSFSGGRLSVPLREVQEILAQDDRLEEVRADIVRPGESTRIVHVLDIFEARAREGGGTYPGFDSAPWGAGQGIVKRFTDMAVLIAAEMPKDKGGLRVTREAVMDMGGSGSAYSPFSALFHLVLTGRPRENVSNAEFDDALRRGAIRVSEYLARAISDAPPDRVERIPEVGLDTGGALPRIAYIYQTQSQGPLLQTFFYGETMDDFMPTVVQPAELFGGALVSGNHSHITVPTYVHLNNPVLKALCRRDGKELALCPVVLTEGHAKTSLQKERRARHVVNLLRFMRADGVVLTQEGGGMSMSDQFMMCRLCEENGIKTTVITFEMCGEDGRDFPLLDAVPAADAIVSVGNRDELVDLPAVEKVLGGDYVRDGRKITDMAEAGAAQHFRLSTVYGAVNQAGANRIRSYLY
ncbi:MAG: glycine/sarcosine/betaine reductase component B subunit [Bacillota bacterium]